MNTSRIYHGGGVGRRGFPGGGGGGGSTLYLYERIWIPADDFKAHPTFPPNGPMTRSLPNTVQTHVWAFTPNEQDMAFAWFGLPSKYWDYNLSVPTGINLRLYWYAEVTASQQVCWAAELAYVRHGETLNFVPPAWTPMYKSPVTQYILRADDYPDFPVYDTTGSGALTEGAFWLKIIRDGSNAADTFSSESYLLGVSVEIPLVFP